MKTGLINAVVFCMLVSACGDGSSKDDGGTGGNGGNGGNGGGSSGGGFTVAITSPINGTTVSGTVTIEVSASDSTNGVAYVEFAFNEESYGAKDMFSPYGFTWDTTGGPDKSVIITARATDKAGNIKLSDPVTVTVHNVTLVAPTNIAWYTVVDNNCNYNGNRDLVISWTDATIGKGSWELQVKEANLMNAITYWDNSDPYNNVAPTGTQTSTIGCLWDTNTSWVTYIFQICRYLTVGGSACSDWQGPISLP